MTTAQRATPNTDYQWRPYTNGEGVPYSAKSDETDLLASHAEAERLRDYLKPRFDAVVEVCGKTEFRVRLDSDQGVAYISNYDDITNPAYEPNWL